jgi:hypothetical protein
MNRHFPRKVGPILSRRERALDAAVEVELQKLVLRARLHGSNWRALSQQLLAGDLPDAFVTAVRDRFFTTPIARRKPMARRHPTQPVQIDWLKPDERRLDHPVSRKTFPQSQSVQREIDQAAATRWRQVDRPMLNRGRSEEQAR